MPYYKEKIRNHPPATTGPLSARGFSLGQAELGGSERTTPRLRRFLQLFIASAIGLSLVLGIATIFIGTRFTQSLHFENRDLSFLSGIRIIGDSFLGTGTALRGETAGRVNILLLGRAGEKYPGRNLTDTIMLLSLDTEKKLVGLLSLPRDLFAPIPGTGLSTKLNSLYQIGLNEDDGAEILRESVAEITGQPIHYYAMIDFDGFERMIDALGGIQVEVMRDIYDPRYPGKNYSYETFELKKGWQRLDGKTALKYARERHDDPEGDFGRTKRQQQIMQAVRDQVWSIPTFLNPFTLSGFLESLGESVTTDIPPEEFGRVIELARSIDTKNVSTIVIDAWKKESLLRVSHVENGGVRAFILVPRSGTWSEIRDAAEHLFEANTLEMKREAMKKESARILVLAAPRYRANAEALVADIRETFPIASVKLQSNSDLDRVGEAAMIQDKSGVRAPYTLDTLIARYGLAVGDIRGAAGLTRDDTDLVILYNQSGPVLPTLDRADTLIGEADFQEPLAPQKNPYTR